MNPMMVRYAELAVGSGVNLQEGQRLLLLSPIEAAPFARELAAAAYRRGCRLVEPVWTDEAMDRVRYDCAPAGSLSEFPDRFGEAMAAEAGDGAAILWIYAFDPDLAAGTDPERVAVAARARENGLQAFREVIRRNGTNWTVLAWPLAGWADRVYPELPRDRRFDALRTELYRLCRVDRDDPEAAWREHVTELKRIRDVLNHRRYRALEFRAPGTELSVGLAEGHRWVSAEARTPGGTVFVANLPTEEIFTMPHRGRVDGTVRSSRPLSYHGSELDDFTLTFREGRVVDARARKGKSLLDALLSTDEGASRLGEVALVSSDSPVARAGRLFHNPLLDENAANHLALGFSYPETLEDGERMEPGAYAAAGGNRSVVHVDFMIGSDEMDVDGVSASGMREPLMRGGRWSAAFAPGGSR